MSKLVTHQVHPAHQGDRLHSRSISALQHGIQLSKTTQTDLSATIWPQANVKASTLTSQARQSAPRNTVAQLKYTWRMRSQTVDSLAHLPKETAALVHLNRPDDIHKCRQPACNTSRVLSTRGNANEGVAKDLCAPSLRISGGCCSCQHGPREAHTTSQDRRCASVSQCTSSSSRQAPARHAMGR